MRPINEATQIFNFHKDLIKLSTMPFCQLYYHIVWATKHRERVLTPQTEAIVTTIIRTKALSLGAQVFALNGAFDHIHLVTSIPAKLAVATFIGQIKGIASTKFNQLQPKSPFYWQSEYGVLSIDARNLPFVMRYVEQQKQHHAADQTIHRLEIFPNSE